MDGQKSEGDLVMEDRPTRESDGIDLVGSKQSRVGLWFQKYSLGFFGSKMEPTRFTRPGPSDRPTYTHSQLPLTLPNFVSKRY
ncbi:DNA (cytosine-5)-methyltransferase CMT2-like protein [Corchorus olitorius]|uniref:DNA (Cytosine-5)-methyltransferase CMT2-like protein n=1 Tax=Corchorus olitorius TaxID=93759 RepID=A0A1R3HAI7_9ROSI|nr:DNA (cytosine-5)-methyltransferase CMT2-like protein [Corchorus olitorius]